MRNNKNCYANSATLTSGWVRCKPQCPHGNGCERSVNYTGVAQQQPQVHVDESPWPGAEEVDVGNCGQEFCLFHAGDRSRAELVEQLGEAFDGVVSSDDFSVYNRYPVTAQQKCLAHLRHFKKVVSLSHGNNCVGQVFLDLIEI